MSYANGTPFLNLAQTIGTDHRDWFDENAAKLDLDTKMKTLWDGAADTATILTSLQESVGSLNTDVTTIEGIVSGHTSTITTINESLVLINTALNALNTQVTNKFDSAGIADPYDASYGIYAVGDVVTYNGQRYVCSTAVTAAEPFDVSKWTAEDVQTVIDGLKTDLLTTITADGVKTRGQLMTEVNQFISNSGLSLTDINKTFLVFHNNSDNTDTLFNREGNTFISVAEVTGTLRITSETARVDITSSGVTYTDTSSTLIASGSTYKLYIR